MNFSQLKQEFIDQQYDSIMLATTANHSTDFLRLPDKIINSQKCMSFSIADEQVAVEVIQLFDSYAHYIYVDIELKQAINLYELVKANIRSSRLREIKPNDLAMDAADILIYKSVKDKEKNIVVVGTGNIGVKLAIRLAERNYNVFLHGRNSDKVNTFVNVINDMLPKYTKKIRPWNKEQIDVLCTMVAAVEVITEEYIPYFNADGLAIDGGIGNFSKGFIQEAHLRGLNILRLDVRISNDVLSGIDQSFNSDFFTAIKGERAIEGVHVVSGGIIGKEGDIIVDRISSPTRVMGIANGIGGVKKIQQLTKQDQVKIDKINTYIEEHRNAKKTI